MELLLEKKGNEIQIMQSVILAVAENGVNIRQLIELLQKIALTYISQKRTGRHHSIRLRTKETSK